jgi:Bacteriocin-protection, YdeI or OmpD-Associated/Domain of unknown function (DUF1905)
MAKKTFTGDLQARGTGAVVEVPFDVKQVFGSARAPVVATVDDVTWRTTVATYGGKYYIGIRRELRDEAGVEVGDEIRLTIESDDSPRTVDVPPDLATALKRDPTANEAFERLSFTHRREYVEWITGAKKDDTRLRRVEKAVEMLREGKTR